MSDIKVSILCLAFNHEPYIRQCLEGFVMQKCDFTFEVLIHDDASKDKTASIIKEYETKYPGIIKPIFQSENQFSKGVKPTFTFNIPRVKGKYIAICEGDDFWTDPLKLQKQVDYMEKNTDCSLCFHPSIHLNDTTNLFTTYTPKFIPSNKKFEMKDAILGGGSFITTNAMFFLSEHISKIPDWFLNAPVNDLPLMLLLATKGKIGYLEDVMSTYRVMSSNSWSFTMQDKKMKKKHYHSVLKMWNDFDKWTNYKFQRIILRKKVLNFYSYWKQILYMKKQLVLKKFKSKR